jgi:hypothetical protein
LCRARGTPCIPLQTPDCFRVHGQWQVPNALFIGTIGPHTLSSSGNTVQLTVAPRATRAIDLGLDEWNQMLPDGLPASGGPLAVVHCDSNSDPDQIARVVDHLAGTVRVQALIALGDLERDAIVDRARQSEIPVLCTECSTRARQAPFSGVDSWFMQPPLEDQAALVAWRTSDLEQRIRSERSLPAGAAIRVALIGQDSPGNEAFVAALRGQLRFNDGLAAAGQGTNYLPLQTPDPARENVDQLGISQQIVNFQPDVLIAAMDADFAGTYLPLVEQQWPAERPRPFYIVTAQNRDSRLLAALDSPGGDLHLRLSGTAPLISTTVARNREGFGARFMREYQEPPEETQSAYDAFYATAYAFAVENFERQFGAAWFAQGMEQLVAGPPINVGPDAIRNVGGYFVESTSIDLAGSSSELAWDTSTGGLTTDATLWCLSRDANGNLTVNYDAGVHWSRTAGLGKEPYSCP